MISRNLIKIIALLLAGACLFSCTPEVTPEGGFEMKGRVISYNGGRLEINVTEAEYAEGPYVALINEGTVITDEAGFTLAADGLQVGDVVKIGYSGQVMMSYPPQVAALSVQRLSRAAEHSGDKKVLLVSIDGLRSDALMQSSYFSELTAEGTCYLSATTVYPSVTLPCHMSMQHGVVPSAHGVTTNSYTPSEQMPDGIAEVLSAAGKTCAFFYNWGPLGSIISDGALVEKRYIAGETEGWHEANEMIAEACLEHLSENDTDFTFLDLGCLDEMGHAHGWLSDEYNSALESSLALVKSITDVLSDEYVVILTTDHGGHGKDHGSELPEDMTIPVVIMGEGFGKGVSREGGSILDIAPTVAGIVGVAPNPAWEGKILQ